MARLIRFNVTCKVDLTMQLICHSILICSIFHLNWRVAHLIQFDATFKVGLTMQLIGHSDDDDDDDDSILVLVFSI